MSAAVRPTSGALATVLAALRHVKRSGAGWAAKCPGHEDPAAALQITELTDGRVTLRCSYGCRARAILDAAGLAAADLAPTAALPALSVAPRDPQHARAVAESRPVLLCETRAVSRELTVAGYTCAWIDTPSGQWESGSASAFAGVPEVIVLPNGGVRSRVWGESVAAGLVQAGIVARLVALPDLPRSSDVLDWLDERGADALDAFDAALVAAAQWDPADGPRPTPSRFTVLTDQELEALPPPSWLWADLLPVGAIAALIGQPGAGKSFVALDLAASIAAGAAPLGRPVTTGTVLYVAAEGTAGLPQRLAAWKHAHGHAGRSIPLHFITQGVNLFAAGDDAQIIAACQQIATPDRPVRLVVIDTLARVMPGGEENSAKDVGLVIEHAERIRRATGATVLLVHHTSKHSDQERGSSALRGAMDTILLLKTDDPDAAAGVKLLVTDKQKDAAPADPVVFTLEPIAVDTAHGRLSSCRVTLSALRWTDAPDDHGPLTRTQLDALRVLRDCFGTSGATATEWMDATGLAKRTFYRSRAALERAGAMLAGHGRGSRFQVTASGIRALQTPQKPVGAVGANSVPSTVPLGGGSQPLKGAGNPTPRPSGLVPRSVSPPDDRLPYRDSFDDDEAPPW